MQYLLDSNICIHFLRNRQNVVEKIMQVGWDSLHISEYTVAELCYGAACSSRPESNMAEVLALCEDLDVLPISDVIYEFARQKAFLRKKGTMIEDADIFIGSTAVVHGMTMVTENTKHLGRLDGIVMDNWCQ